MYTAVTYTHPGRIHASTFLCDIILLACRIPVNGDKTCINSEFAGADGPHSLERSEVVPFLGHKWSALRGRMWQRQPIGFSLSRNTVFGILKLSRIGMNAGGAMASAVSLTFCSTGQSAGGSCWALVLPSSTQRQLNLPRCV